jgi:GTPase Era involved in 16S rRNA processing
VEERKDGSLVVRQTILVERVTHRAMVLAKAAQGSRRSARRPRLKCSSKWAARCICFLEVKVDERWQERGEFYSLFGLEGR